MIGNITRFFYDLALQRNTPTTNSWGDPIGSFITIATIRGCIMRSNENQVFVGSVVNTDVKYRLYCLPCDIQKDDRVLYQGHYFKINQINDVMFFGRLYQCECDVYE